MPSERGLLLSALTHLAGHTYDSAARPAPGTQDCTRLCYAVMVDLFGERVKAYSEPLHITDAARPFSNVEAAANFGHEVQEPMPGHWHYVQGWKSLSPLRGGHAFLWYEAPIPLADASYIIQATPAALPWCQVRTWADQAAKFQTVRLAALTLA